MKLILSKCKTSDFDEVSRILSENNYIQIGDSRVEPQNNLEMFLFLKVMKKSG